MFTTIFRSVEVVEGADARLRRSDADNKGEVLLRLKIRQPVEGGDSV